MSKVDVGDVEDADVVVDMDMDMVNWVGVEISLAW